MKTVCARNSCNGCMLCKAICPRAAIRVEEGLKSYDAFIDEARCVSCNQCERLCPRNHLPVLRKPVEWHQGWAADPAIREGSSSGGLATALALQFVRDGGICISCLLREGRFVFAQATSADEVLAFRGSKYVKSDPSAAYGLVRQGLAQGRKVLFVGLPCQVAGLLAHPDISRHAEDNLFTVDLICHGTPSPKLLEAFLNENKSPLPTLKSLSFRDKTLYRIRTDGKKISKSKGRDWYMAAFMRTLTFTDNCYDCPFSRLERVTDLTLGDSWGTSLPSDEWKRGVSLILCQTSKGAALLQCAGIHLEPVDLEKAVAANVNLSHPCPIPSQREQFFHVFEGTGRFSTAMRKTHPKLYFKTMLNEWFGI